MIKKIKITEADLQTTCPVETAIERETGCDSAVADYDCIVMMPTADKKTRVVLNTTKSLADFLMAFDAGENVEPIEFEIEYEQWN